jgi:hypothetical protein
MADWKQGDTVKDYFTVVDEADTLITGATFDVGSTEDPDGDEFDLVITEIGGGVYRVTFLAAKVGTYYYRVDTNNLDPAQMWEETFTVGPVTLYGAAIGTGAYGNTLGNLIKRVATRVKDFAELEATAQGSEDGTTLFDNLRLAAIPAGSLKGAGICCVYPTTADIYLEERRVQDSSEENQLLTITPPFSGQVQIGDGFHLTNLQSKGYWRNQYRNAINEVIAAIHPMHLVPVSYDYPDLFYSDDPYVPAPLHLTHIYGVQAETEWGIADIPFSDQNIRGLPGWSVDYSNANILINGSWANTLNEASIRLLGYGRPAELVNFDDYTTVEPGFLVPAAASILKLSTGDQKQLAVASMFENTSMAATLQTITQVQPGTLRIR